MSAKPSPSPGQRNAVAAATKRAAGPRRSAPQVEGENEILSDRLREDPDFARRWNERANRRATASMLADLRARAGFSQRELARRAGWRQAQVARLEAPTGPDPSLNTFLRFVAACDQDAALVVGHSDTRTSGLRIEDGVWYAGPQHADPEAVRKGLLKGEQGA